MIHAHASGWLQITGMITKPLTAVLSLATLVLATTRICGEGGEPGEGCAGGIPVPVPVTRPTEPAEARLLTRIHFQFIDGHLTLPVRINGSRPLTMVLDTGMSAPIVLLSRPGIAEELDLKEGRPTLIGGAGGQQARQGWFYPGARVSVGDVTLNDQTLVAMGACGSPSPCIQDGVIGKSIFDLYPTEIDFEASLLSIYQGAATDSEGYVSLPLELTQGIPVVTATAACEDGREVPVRLVLDLGASHGLLLHLNAEKGISAPGKSFSAVVGRGVQGEIPGKIGRLRSLRLGRFTLRNLISSFAAVEEGASCGSRGLTADGNLGGGILSRFHLILDYPRGRLLIKPNSRFGDAFDYNMAGLSLERREDGSYQVRSVMSSSPGEEAGLEAGDRIVGIDDRMLTDSPGVDFTDRFLRKGASLAVTVERAGSRFQRTLRLRRLI